LIFRPLQFFVKHRGVIHSFTTGIVLSVLLAFFWPVASLGFFIGYSVHLICDSFTKEGIQPFWPLRARSKGFIATGGRIEDSLFVFLVLVDAVLIVLILILGWFYIIFSGIFTKYYALDRRSLSKLIWLT